MGIFGKAVKVVKDWDERSKETPEQKKAREEEQLRKDVVAILRKLNLDPDFNSEEDIHQEISKEMVRIWQHGFAKGIREFDIALKGNAFETLSVDLLSSLYHQNWVLIRQNTLLLKLIKDLKEALLQNNRSSFREHKEGV